jgi:hypothetical protein
VENYSPHLHIGVAQYSIIHSHVNYAFRLKIVQEVGGRPGFGSQASQRTIQIVKDVSEGGLIADFDRYSGGIKLYT